MSRTSCVKQRALLTWSRSMIRCVGGESCARRKIKCAGAKQGGIMKPKVIGDYNCNAKVQFSGYRSAVDLSYMRLLELSPLRVTYISF